MNHETKLFCSRNRALSIGSWTNEEAIFKQIDGIGEKYAKMLSSRFKSLQDLESATSFAIETVKSICSISIIQKKETDCRTTPSVWKQSQIEIEAISKLFIEAILGKKFSFS